MLARSTVAACAPRTTRTSAARSVRSPRQQIRAMAGGKAVKDLQALPGVAGNKDPATSGFIFQQVGYELPGGLLVHAS
jgi:hypothetical protein